MTVCKDIPHCCETITSTLTSKAQTTIPLAIRKALGVEPGDILNYEIAEGFVILSKAQRSVASDDPFATFTEWDSEADRKAYADL